MEDIVEILESCLGSNRGHYSNRGQIKFNCPNCDMGYNKGNLEVNYHKNVYSCWSCRDTEGGIKGIGIKWLIWNYGSKDLFFEYCKIDTSAIELIEKINVDVQYPEGFKNFSDVNKKHFLYNEAYDYLISRGLTHDIIINKNLGFTSEGKYKNRIIVPSYDINGMLNYFIGRDFTGETKFSYMNHENSKQDIIFNEADLNYEASVFLVEGVFDHLVLKNSLPILGKTVSNLLITELQKKLLGNLYILLDADAKDAAKDMKDFLNFGNLRGKIYIIDLPENEDVSSLNQKNTKSGFYNALINGIKM